jgi:beta-lactamase regulating signal transducer with metallopeptidase domain
MSLVSYILTSILLSWLGLGVYLLFRRFAAPLLARRILLWMVVGLALLLPLMPEFIAPAQPVSVKPTDIGAPLKTRQSRPDEDENRSLLKANEDFQLRRTKNHAFLEVPISALHEFCHCSNPGAGDVIRYQASLFNDVMLEYRPLVWGIFAFILLAVLLRFSAALVRLMWLTRKFAAETVWVDGVRVRLVRGFPGVQAGALRLGGRYIFWQSSLDALPGQEQQAILRHELSHIRQGNTFERLVLGLSQCVWFLNPAYYFISRELVQLSEYTADRYAVSHDMDAKAYARLLLKVKTQPELAFVAMVQGGELKQRVQAILNPGQTNKSKFGIAIALGLALLLPGELFAENFIHRQIREIAVYEYLSQANHETGKEEFCRKCTYEAVDACE